jgi:hypothetical protein
MTSKCSIRTFHSYMACTVKLNVTMLLLYIINQLLCHRSVVNNALLVVTRSKEACCVHSLASCIALSYCIVLELFAYTH